MSERRTSPFFQTLILSIVTETPEYRGMPGQCEARIASDKAVRELDAIQVLLYCEFF